ncbi:MULTISPECIES: extracellular solute-binding protein [Paenibacillus]|uniref:ABC transporter substrate-binding protein n=1 Tax=Paenibacillus odorifer TaxID=189426 RepID=A0A1R0WV25_9BACL|nr:extracellular solute-binding protein [Paenibacillus odorifer]MEC0131326.1 extracellular solute-binding protein [Paenibacillus odorifer]MEC0222035.1 extracellular solute-binding protein [Paenibacillus odorifer]OMD05007.1 ABC transporter substrate-binding protein [Paenibacillus odorifer]OMD21845.1 ABC transporter substrate-binding protein [Paenibacillus odorifer]OME35948.1 ABC transporter substrate-binding protein [Paenibacillus odorifer]
MIKKNKWLNVSITAALAVGVLAGCASNDGKNNTNQTAGDDKKQEPITLTWFDSNTKGEPFTDAIAQEITKKTGISISIQQPTGNPTEKLSLMLASGDYPDVVVMSRGDASLDKYITSGAFIALDELIEKSGPDIKEMYGDTLIKTRYKDGKNYYLANWYGLDSDPVFGMLMRKNLVADLAPDKADGSTPLTTDEYEALLKNFKEKNKTIDGKETVPMTMNGENMGANLGTFKGMWGLRTYYDNNGTLQYDVKDPKYREMLLYVNSLYREGLIEKEFAISKTQTWIQKLATGAVFSTPGAYWDPGNANGTLKKDGGDDNQFFPYKVVAPGTETSQTTFGPRSSLGWDAIAITKNNKHPEETIKLFNYLASDEGQHLLLWGKEGEQYTMVDGKRQPDPAFLQSFKDNWDDAVKKSGVRKWLWFVKNGLDANEQPYDMAVKYQRSEIDEMAIKSLGDSVWDTAEFDNLGPDGGTPEALTAQKVKDIMDQSITRVIIAPSEAEANSTFDKMLADMKKAGDEKVEEIFNQKYSERMELWNSK